ncbi:MAG: hypothetical protein CR977_00185 [Gammaproteobacteria bacterium]|nr:MAG: hypothetical protein CR977_00185 [Gammaproteobacteria bacterium]
MNKKLLSAAVLLGLSSAATAVNVNKDGLGSVLLYPYYTTNGDKFTNIEVVNTTNQTKAVKVRFIEGVNSWEVLDFNLYMSPYDVWTAVVYNDGTGTFVKTTDTSCTAPELSTQPLSPALIEAYSESHKDPGSLSSADRLREGYLEILEMGVITDPVVAAAVKHDATGVPKDCSVIRDAWSNGYWSTSPTVVTGDQAQNQIAAPAGGLYGAGTIVDTTNGSAAGYDATAVESFYTAPAHANPGSSFPNIAGRIQSGGNVVDTSASKTSNVIVNNQVVTTNWADPADAMSAVLMASGVYNSYALDAGIVTDWVITFPTKHAYVNERTDQAGTVGGLFAGQFGFLPAGVTGMTTGKAPFASGFTVPLNMTIYNREEQLKNSNIQFSPFLTTQNGISYEVNVLEFGKGGASVFKSNLANRVNDTDFENGWASVNFSGGSLVAPLGPNNGSTHTYKGYPVVGFAMQELQGGTSSAGSLTNYGALYNHKYNRSVTVS